MLRKILFAATLIAGSSTLATAQVEWGLDRLDQSSKFLDNEPFNPVQTGKNVHVYVVDTGVAWTHQDFENITAGYHAPQFLDSYDDDENGGHGTALAGLITGQFGVAPDALIHPVKVHQNDGEGNDTATIAGLQWIQQNVASHAPEPAIVLIGFSIPGNTPLDAEVNSLIQDGITVVAPVHDFFGDTSSSKLASNYSPGRVADVITVAGTGRHQLLRQFSGDANYTESTPVTEEYGVIAVENPGGVDAESAFEAFQSGLLQGQDPDPSQVLAKDYIRTYPTHGTAVDILAPGSFIKSASNINSFSYQHLTGSEMAAAFAAGMAAHYLEVNPLSTPAQVKAYLLSEASTFENTVPSTSTTKEFLQLSDVPPRDPIESPINFEINVNSGGVDMGWTDTSPNTEKFILQYSTDLEKWEPLEEFPPSQVTYHINEHPVPGTPNFYRLFAASTSSLSTAAAPASVSYIPQGQAYVPPIPAAPSGANATGFFIPGPPTGSMFMGVKVTWNDNSSNETHFRIEKRHVNSSVWTSIMNASANATAVWVNDTSLKCSPHYFRVIAVNDVGESLPSNQDYYYYCD